MSKVALVFGGSGGIGQAICSLLEKKKITVYSTSYRKFNKNNNPNILYCNITKENDIKNVVSNIFKKEGRLDLVINSVTSKLKLKTIENLSKKEFQEDIDTILMGGINIAQTVIPIMKTQQEGIIVNILSALVLGNVSSRMSSYISAKYGLLGFTKCLALELKPFNISVFGVSPALVKTDLIKAFPDKLIQLEGEKRKVGKIIDPSEVAKVVLEIVQNSQKYQTGENIEII